MTTVFLSCPHCGEQLEKTIDYAAILRLRCPKCDYKKDGSQPDHKKIENAQGKLLDDQADYSADSYIGIGWW